MNITDVGVGVYRVPLATPWGDQTHRITSIDLIVVEVASDAGLTGTGFSYTVGVGARAIESVLRWDLLPKVIGAPVDPRPLFRRLWMELHDAGGGGLSTMAIAPIDIAVWDLVAQERGRPLVDVLGRFRDRIAAYGSGVNLDLTLDELLAQVDGWLAAGYAGFKVKVGKPDIAADIERVAAVRALVGPGRRLVDANQGWDLSAAVGAIRALSRFDLHWVEEPLISDDVVGHERLKRAADVPIAAGENVYTSHQFADYLDRGAIDYVQADVVRVGGITPWLDIAGLAAVHGRPMAPHFLRELSGQLLLAIPNAHVLEDVAGGSFTELGVLESGFELRAGMFAARDVPGHGIRFDRAALERHRLSDEPPRTQERLWRGD